MTPREKTIRALRDCAKGLLHTARQWKAQGRPDRVSEVVRSARWHWHWYLREISQ
jgi:hypothetical protein